MPGAVDAWLLLLRDHGSMPLRVVLEPAIDYARNGHPLVPRVGETVGTVQELFEEHWPTSAALWLKDGRAPSGMFRNEAYAATLEKLVQEGEAAGADRQAQVERARKAWRAGFVAEAIDKFSRLPHRDSSGSDHGGLITGDDLAGFEASWEEPATLDWNGYTVAKTGPWGQGPALLQSLAVLAELGDVDLDTAEGVHTTVEVMKLSYADREAWYGDGADVPLKTLLSPAYAAERAKLIGPDASKELRPGRPDGRTPVLPSVAVSNALGDATTGEPTVSSEGVMRGDTCHVDVIDKWGNVISATPSGGWLQSSPTIPELGFCLGSRLQMFWLEEGLASSLKPGLRPRTTLTPTLVSRDGQPVLACGSPGGDQQDQWQLLFLLRHLGSGMDLQEAIDAPAWHTTGFPSSFYPRASEPGGLAMESRLGAAVRDELVRRGHVVTEGDAWSLGRLCAVRKEADGVLAAAANPRGMQGYAVGR